MTTTLDLMNKAFDRIPSGAEWCRRLGIARTTFAVAKIRGHLSPMVAGMLAHAIGEPDPTRWIALAAVEAEEDSKAKREFMKQLQACLHC